jgi:hypothetical protein
VVYFTRCCGQRAFVAAGPGVLAALSAFVTSCTAKPIRFGIQQCPFNISSNHLAKMISDPGFINLNDVPHRLQSIVFTRCFDPSSKPRTHSGQREGIECLARTVHTGMIA